MKKDSFLYVVIFTFVVAFVFVFVISLVNNATADRVARNQELVSAEAYLNTIGVSADSPDKILSEYDTLFGSVEAGDVVRTEIDGETILVKEFIGDGLWGAITGVIAVNKDVSRIIGMDIISHAETPGLGGRIEENWFKEQFRGERIPPDGIAVRKGDGTVDSDPDNGSVDGVTGATLTSFSMRGIINSEIESLRKEVTE